MPHLQRIQGWRHPRCIQSSGSVCSASHDRGAASLVDEHSKLLYNLSWRKHLRQGGGRSGCCTVSDRSYEVQDERPAEESGADGRADAQEQEEGPLKLEARAGRRHSTAGEVSLTIFGSLQARGAQTLANLRTKRVEQQEESKEAASVATSTALLCGAPSAERRPLC